MHLFLLHKEINGYANLTTSNSYCAVCLWFDEGPLCAAPPLCTLVLRPVRLCLRRGAAARRPAASRPYLPGQVSYIGMDASRGMLRRGQAKCASGNWPASFVQADAEALPFAAARTAFVLAMGVLQHLHDPRLAVAELMRVARPGTRLLVIDEHRAQKRILAAFRPDQFQPQAWCEYFVLDLAV
ncbi:MAG: methyltransferase domain-containing protein [Anaerolineales bacterium]